MITAERLRELLDYDPETGVFTWKIKKGRSGPGQIAGCTWKGKYHRIVVDRKIYATHMLCFLYMTGKIPDNIDHIDRNGNNNRWDNLRATTLAQNAQNKELTARNSSGYIGVYQCATTGRWASQLRENGNVHWIGRFDTPQEAAKARDRLAKTLHGSFAVLNFPE